MDDLSRFLVEVNRNFISAIALAVLSDSEHFVHFSIPKWLIYVPRSREVLRIMNQTNGTGDLDRRGVICLFMRVSIARGSCAKADFRTIILGPRSSTLRVIGIYYTLEVRLPASSFVREQEVPLLPERRKPIPIVRPSSNSPEKAFPESPT